MNNQKFFQKRDIRQQKKDIAISINKNIACLDLLENLEVKFDDIYKYSQDEQDRITLEKIKWIKFQIEYNIGAFNMYLKKLGGQKVEVQLTEW